MRKLVCPLLSILLGAAVLLGLYNLTIPTRQANAAAELQERMSVLLPGSTTFTEETCDGEDANIRAAYKGETGYVVAVTTAGYADEISMLVGVSNEGTVTGLQIRDMHETFGLGGRALTDWEFLAQFLRGDGSAEVGTNIDALSGATVTSKAVARGVNSAVAFVTGADVSSGATTWGG